MDDPREDNLDSLTFEQALGKLDAIVEELDGEDISLDRLVGRYDEGMKLLAHCQKRLADARLRITMVEKPVTPETAPGTDPARSDPEADVDEIELF